MRRSVRIPVVAALALVLAFAPAWPSTKTLKLVTLVPDGSVWHEGLKTMAAEWTKASGGQVTVRIYPGGVAGDEPDMILKMGLNQYQAAAFTVAGLMKIEPSFGIVALPLFYESYDELLFVLDRLEPELRKRAQAKGFEMISWGLAGWLHVFTKQPVATVEELRKVKMFTSAGDDAWVQMWKRRGFNPVPIAMTDITTGLQTGLIDGVPSTPLATLQLQWFRHAPNMLDLGIAPLVGALVVTKKTWDGLPAEQQAAFAKSAKAYEAALREQVPEEDRKAVEAMKQRGLKVNAAKGTIDPWRQTAAELGDYMRDNVIPKDVYDLAVKARAEYRASKGAAR